MDVYYNDIDVNLVYITEKYVFYVKNAGIYCYFYVQ